MAPQPLGLNYDSAYGETVGGSGGGTPGARILTAGRGTYILTGMSVSFGLKMPAAAGSFVMTGNPVTLSAPKKLAAQPGTFIWTVDNMTPSVGYAVPADVGSFTLTGVPAALRTKPVLIANVGSFTMTGVPATLTTTQNPYYNFNVSQFSVASDACIRVTSGNGRALGVVVGDSTSAGFFGGDTAGSMVNAKANSWPSVMAKRLTTLGIQSNWENIAGTIGNVGVSPDVTFQTGGYKTGLNMGAAWTAQGAATTMGGAMFTTISAGTFTYTPEMAVDNFELWDVINAGLGTIQYNIDGGANTNLVQAGSAASRRTVIPAGSAGTHTLNVKWVSAQTYLGGVRAWNSTVKAFDWMNCGRGSSTTTDWVLATNPYSSLPVLTNLCASADMVIIQLGENDELQGLAQATFKAQYQSIINAAAAGGANVMLVTPFPVSTATCPDATQQAMRQWCHDLADTNNLPLLDLHAYYINWDTMNAAGLMFSGGHPNKAGYADAGTLIGNTINTWTTAAAGTAPVLSSPLVTGFSGTTANLSVVTSKGNGTLYYVIDTSATPPSAPQVKTGKGSSGATAMSSGNQTVTVRGTQTKNGASGLTNGVTSYAYFMHEDSGGHQSTVAATAAFTPTTQVTGSWIDSAVDATSQTTYTFAGKVFNTGPVDATKIVVVDIEARFGGTTITANSCVIGGVTATKVDEARNTTGGASTMLTRWQAVGAGTGSTVTTTYSGAVSRAGAMVGAILNSNGSAPTGAATAHATGTTAAVSATLASVPANSTALIGGGMNQLGSTPSVTPTNYVTDIPSTFIGTSHWMTGGHDTNNTGSRAYTITWSVATSPGTSMVASVWSP